MTRMLRQASPVPAGSARGKRVAIIGARGIGRHHARWWHLEGAEVCAFLGTSEVHLRQAHEAMRRLFPVTARGYTDLHEMLTTEQPDFIDVCSPNACHYEHVLTALEAGCHVLCEKPLVYDKTLPTGQLIGQACALVEKAEARGLILSLCSQYAIAARVCRDLFDGLRPGAKVSYIGGQLASPAKGRPPNPAAVWIDLAPHILAAVEEMCPGALSRMHSPVRDFHEYHAKCDLTITCDEGSEIACCVNVHRTTGKPANIRQLQLNDLTFRILGENDDEGIFRAAIVVGDRVFRYEDMMHILVRETAAGVPPVHGRAIVHNLQALLSLLP